MFRLDSTIADLNEVQQGRRRRPDSKDTDADSSVEKLAVFDKPAVRSSSRVSRPPARAILTAASEMDDGAVEVSSTTTRRSNKRKSFDYSDIENVPPQVSNVGAISHSTVGKKPSFLNLFHRMVTEQSEQGSTLVYWTQGGTSVALDLGRPELLAETIHLYFSHGKIESLRRQLSFYNFARDSSYVPPES